MKLYLKNKIISVGNGSSIKDQHGKDFFRVNGKPFSKRKKKYLCDLSGKTLYRIQNKWFNFLKHTAYIFDASGKKVATIVKKAFTGPVTPRVPASILQFHPDVTVVADEAALSLI